MRMKAGVGDRVEDWYFLCCSWKTWWLRRGQGSVVGSGNNVYRDPLSLGKYLSNIAWPKNGWVLRTLGDILVLPCGDHRIKTLAWIRLLNFGERIGKFFTQSLEGHTSNLTVPGTNGGLVVLYVKEVWVRCPQYPLHTWQGSVNRKSGARAAGG